MATLTVQTVIQAQDTAMTLASAAGGGDEFANNGRTFFQVDNADASSTDVTFDSTQACDQGGDHDLTVTVPATTTYLIGPFPTARYNDGGGLVQVTYTSVTSLTVGAFNLSANG